MTDDARPRGHRLDSARLAPEKRGGTGLVKCWLSFRSNERAVAAPWADAKLGEGSRWGEAMAGQSCPHEMSAALQRKQEPRAHGRFSTACRPRFNKPHGGSTFNSGGLQISTARASTDRGPMIRYVRVSSDERRRCNRCRPSLIPSLMEGGQLRWLGSDPRRAHRHRYRRALEHRPPALPCRVWGRYACSRHQRLCLPRSSPPHP